MYYVHYWDYTTSIKAIMDALHILVEQGKMLYLGAFDMPAWAVALLTHTPLIMGRHLSASGHWNVMDRAFEREIIPMARHFGMALAP